MKKCWKKVSGTKNSYSYKDKWVSVTKVPKGYAVDTAKNGVFEIIGRAKTKKEAEKIRNKFMRTHGGC